ncbi:MAG: hypothetical protein WBN34_15425 [Woeseia sp.]
MTATKLSRAFYAYRAFKYTIYCLLALNIWLFFLEDYAASSAVFTDGVDWRNTVEAFSATIDTLAWVTLLLLFELETAVISDDKLKGGLKWILSAIRVTCYFFITYSLYGYWVKYGVVTDVTFLTNVDACDLVANEYLFVDSLDNYFPITPEICSQMTGEGLWQIAGTQIVGTEAQIELARTLALVDIINASDWLLVVLLLEGEVWLQLKGRLSSRLLAINKFAKGILYTILFACAIYWGIDGDFLDFWDAFLWLVAFIFIEMNIFEWHAESTLDKNTDGTAPSAA